MKHTEIYLDNAATTAVDPRVMEEMSAYLDERGDYGNPSSSHAWGVRARQAVERARQQAAARIGAAPEDIVFTSGATESNNLALFGVIKAAAGRGHIVTARTEHHAVLDTAKALKAEGVDVTLLSCDADGSISADSVAAAIRDDTALVSIMHANNEIGVVQHIEAIGAVCRERGVPFHVDAAQSAGKLAIDLRKWPVDLMSLTAHKAHGPKGIGALYWRKGTRIEPLFHGGGQERGLRPGTLATHQIVGMGKAFELADPAREGPRLAKLRNRLWEGLREIDGLRLNGSVERRAPHILNVCFPGVDGESLRLALSGIAVSAGSACASDHPEASHVLSSLGLSDALAQSSVRFSVGRFNTAAEVEHAAERVAAEVERLRSMASAAPAWCSS